MSKGPFCYNIKVENGNLAINPNRDVDNNSFFVSQKLMENQTQNFQMIIYQRV